MQYILFICIMVLVDQYTKHIAIHRFKKRKVDLMNGKIQLIYVENYGVAFNLYSHKRKRLIFFNSICMIILAIILYNCVYVDRNLQLATGISLMIGGGLGNLVDRVRQGYVVDFLYFNIKKWPVFNLADFFVFAGAIILMLGGGIVAF